MAKAEQTAVFDRLSIELCPDQKCTCRHSVHEPDQLRVGRVQVDGKEINTPLYLSPDFGVESIVVLPGVHRLEDVERALNDCDGAVELSSGEIVCGAIHALRERTANGREEI